MGNAWFRMYVDFLEDTKMLGLAFEDQRHFIGVLALKCSGVLDQECSPQVMDRLVAQRLWIDHSAIQEVKRRLVEPGLIDQNWQPVAWGRRQFRSDHDPTGAERQRRHKEKKRNALGNARGNAKVTPLDTDTDTDIPPYSPPKGGNARFVAPTPDEVSAYARSIGYALDAHRFCDHYASVGWKVGNRPMKDWRAAVRTWRQRDNEKAPPKRAERVLL